jgi:hypothetical protein
MITKTELAEGIRFAGKRSAAAARYVQNWDHQLAHKWTTKDAFTHVAATSAALSRLYPMLDGGMLSGVGVDAVAQMNDQAIAGMADKSQEDIAEAIEAGQNESAAFLETLNEDDLAKEITLGGYKMPKAELVAQIWINHQLAHSYEGAARWPIT